MKERERALDPQKPRHFHFFFSLSSLPFLIQALFFYYDDDRVALRGVLARPCLCVVFLLACSCPAPWGRLRRLSWSLPRSGVVVIADAGDDDLVVRSFFFVVPLVVVVVVRHRSLDGAAGKGRSCQRVPLAGAGTEEQRCYGFGWQRFRRRRSLLLLSLISFFYIFFFLSFHFDSPPLTPPPLLHPPFTSSTLFKLRSARGASSPSRPRPPESS